MQRISARRIRNISERMNASESFKKSSGGQAPVVAARARVDQSSNTAVNKNPADRKTPICLAHDVAQSKRCANAENGKCSFVHLDTRKPEEFKRFTAASRAFELRTRRRGGERR